MSGEVPIDLRVRRATASDNALLSRLGAETFFDPFAADNSLEDMAAYLSEAFNPGRQGHELAEPASTFLVAEVAGLPVGYTRLKTGSAPEAVRGRKPIEIARFYAQREWIGRRVGARLMEACLVEALRAECDVVWLDVWERNYRAIGFYTGWGFEEVGSQAFQLGEDRQRDLVMARVLGCSQTEGGGRDGRHCSFEDQADGASVRDAAGP